jgi:outer membrane protein
MRKLLLVLICLPLSLAAQNKFGYFSYRAVLDSLPQFHEAIDGYNKLKQRCNEEIEHNELRLTRTYVSFLDGHRNFPEPILRKRQNELQQLIDNSVHFRDEVKMWLREAKDSLCAPCYDTIAVALKRVCTELKYSYAIDTDKNIYRYINPEMGEDITGYILKAIFHPELPLVEIVETEEETGDVVTEAVETTAAETVEETTEAEADSETENAMAAENATETENATEGEAATETENVTEKAEATEENSTVGSENADTEQAS